MRFSKLKMDEKLSVHGLIILENNEEVNGMLEYDDNTITLTFVKLRKKITELDPDFVNVEFLSSYGERIFLKNGKIINVLMNSNGISTYVVDFEYLFLLKSIKENHKLNIEKFNQVYLNYPQFKKVLNNNPHNYLYDKEVDYITGIERKIKSELNTEFVYKENKIKVNDHLETSQGINNELSLSIGYKAYLKLSAEKLISFEDVIDLTFKFRNLLSFVLEQKIKLKEFYIKNETCHFKVFWSKEIDIIESKSKNSLRSSDIKKYFNDNFSDIVKGYFNHTKELEDIFEIYVNNMYVQHYYLDSYLLSQIAILEGLHKRFVSKKRIDLIDRLKDIFDSIDDGRLNKILNDAKISNKEINRSELVEYLKELRNYHSHYYLKKHKEISIKKEKLLFLLRNIAKEFIYEHIGVNDSFILSKAEQYKFEKLELDETTDFLI